MLEEVSVNLMAEATQALRDERKTLRFAGEKIRGPVRERPAPVGEDAVRIGGSLYAQHGIVHCRNCHGIISAATDNPKQSCLIIRIPFNKANPWIALRLKGDNPELALREYACPGCGALLFVDARRTSEPDHWWDYRLDILQPEGDI